MEKIIDPRHHRRSIRLPGYDYTTEGGYFITCVTHQRVNLFGKIIDGEMYLNDFGKIVKEEWLRTARMRPNIELDEDEFVVMPNHIHGIIWILESNEKEGLGKGTARRALTPDQFGVPIVGSLATIVGAFKTAVTKRINLLRRTPSTQVWLRNYYEHIISTEKEYENIVNYIDSNPSNWGLKDEYYQ